MTPRGRPKGSRNVVSHPHQVAIRLTEDDLGWCTARAGTDKTVSDVIRDLIAAERKREQRRKS